LWTLCKDRINSLASNSFLATFSPLPASLNVTQFM